MTAEEIFNQQMKEPAFKKWYKSRPPAIQDLARKYPYDTYIIKEGAPYGVSAPGQIVHFHCFTEHLFSPPGVKVIVLGSEKIPAVLSHEEFLFTQHNMKARGHTLAEVHTWDNIVEVDPIWLEPINLETVKLKV